MPDAVTRTASGSVASSAFHLLLFNFNLTTHVVEAYNAHYWKPNSWNEDRAGAGLPIFRDDPRDPDDGNALATACMRIKPYGVAFDVWQSRARVLGLHIETNTGRAGGAVR
ncbi:hypothetical protein SAMN05421548_113146 [Paraburkholderia lycopersici]|uniref:Uncharacterized protein n=1 Tax=Paraburkholderia lycopersici TaxID=416944 RepID=A0A1G6RKT2_9BURK|nr:hypothetical protein SAMN05421548_113146 [Paraburkholderia lycopersici]